MAIVKKLFFQVLLFALGPFFAYPWKPFAHKIIGDTYSVALAHFKKGHYGVTNLAGHLACLFIQVAGNFGLLRVLDDKIIPQPIPGVRLLSLQTAVAWALYLFVASAAPVDVKVLSAFTIALGYALAPLMEPSGFEQVSVAAYIVALAVADLLLSKKKKIGLAGYAKVALLPAILMGRSAFASRYAGVLSEQYFLVTAATLSALVVLAAIPNPIKKVVVVGMVICRLASILIGSPELFYLGYAFSASFIQGVTHLATREEATLIALGDKGGADELASEWAHVVYFPCLLLQTVRDKLLPRAGAEGNAAMAGNAPSDPATLTRSKGAAGSVAQMKRQ